MHLYASVVFQARQTLEEVGEAISERLLGGIQFVGREEHLRDEVPAIRTESDVFGLRCLIQGVGGESGYTLEVYPTLSSDPSFQATGPDDEVDLSLHFAILMSRLPGISV